MTENTIGIGATETRSAPGTTETAAVPERPEDRLLAISVGLHAESTYWENRRLTYTQLRERLKAVLRTQETAEEYLAMGKEQRKIAKDHGGFVGGSLKNGKRSIAAVEYRSMVTLDADRADPELLEHFEERVPWTAFLYTTHSSTPRKPRARIILPCTRDMTPEEFGAVSRYAAETLGMKQFDECSFRVNQLMFWPSAPSDGEFVYREAPGKPTEPGRSPWLDPDELLAAHPDWREPLSLPLAQGEIGISTRPGKNGRSTGRLRDPLEKQGVVGAFNRVYYPITKAMEELLPGVYTPGDRENRWHFAESDSGAGALILDDGRFLNSFHATDPASGYPRDAFHLVMCHKFGDPEDREAFDAMRSLALKNEDVRVQVLADRFARADAKASLREEQTAELNDHCSTPEAVTPGSDAAPVSPVEAVPVSAVDAAPTPAVDTAPAPEVDAAPASGAGTKAAAPEDLSWLKELDVSKESGKLQKSLNNAVLILRNDPKLRGLRRNAFADQLEITDAPWLRKFATASWRDADDAKLRNWIAQRYCDFGSDILTTAIRIVADDRAYNPVQDYLKSLPAWDGKTRVENLLIDCFDAEASDYTRTVTRKTFVGAVARAMQPGCKFDTMLVLCGKQGQKKSSLLNRLAGKWFMDDISFAMAKDKTAAEKLQGVWIVEFSELRGLKNEDVNGAKNFLSGRVDRYRAAYDRRPADHPRQCIFIGTTNSVDGFLYDTTGNRRFWPVMTRKAFGRNPDQISDAFVQQFWAEAVWLYRHGETWWIEDDRIVEAAQRKQKEAMESDDRQGIVEDYLDRLLPEEKIWKKLSLTERRNFLNGIRSQTGPRLEGTVRRDRVCNMEIWCECFLREQADLTRKETNQISRIMAKLPGWEKLPGKERFGFYGTVSGYKRIDEKPKNEKPGEAGEKEERKTEAAEQPRAGLENADQSGTDRKNAEPESADQAAGLENADQSGPDRKAPELPEAC